MRVGDVHGVLNLGFRQFQLLGDLAGARFPSKLLIELTLGFPDPVQRSCPIERQTNDAGMLGERLEHRLANPPDCIRNKLVPAFLVKAVRGLNETEVAVVDKIFEGQPLIRVLLRDRDDESEVRFDEPVKRVLVSLFDLARKSLFLFTLEQGCFVDLVEVNIEAAVPTGAIFLTSASFVFGLPHGFLSLV